MRCQYWQAAPPLRDAIPLFDGAHLVVIPPQWKSAAPDASVKNRQGLDDVPAPACSFSLILVVGDLRSRNSGPSIAFILYSSQATGSIGPMRPFGRIDVVVNNAGHGL